MNIIDAIRRLFGLGSSSKQDVPVVPHDPCNDDPACVDARDRLKAARSAITPLCDNIRRAKAVADAAASILFSPWMAVAIVVAIAAWVIFGGLAGAAVVALLALYATLMVVYLGALAVLRGLGPALDQRRMDFTNALQHVLAHCSPECRGGSLSARMPAAVSRRPVA